MGPWHSPTCKSFFLGMCQTSSHAGTSFSGSKFVSRSHFLSVTFTRWCFLWQLSRDFWTDRFQQYRFHEIQMETSHPTLILGSRSQNQVIHQIPLQDQHNQFFTPNLVPESGKISLVLITLYLHRDSDRNRNFHSFNLVDYKHQLYTALLLQANQTTQ